MYVTSLLEVYVILAVYDKNEIFITGYLHVSPILH
jgi:hypothetical protein